jgi:hypothetical protein
LPASWCPIITCSRRIPDSPGALSPADWESLWSPYDAPTYEAVEQLVPPGSVVLEIGAGDLRLARRLARVATRVIAVEIQPELGAAGPLPANMTVVRADARDWPFPAGVDVAVLLMRHCRHVGLYIDKLTAAGCRWLVTNARWGVDVERIDLRAPRLPFTAVRLGWYACRCGGTGFVPGPPNELVDPLLETVHEVDYCPECSHGRNRHRLP